MDIKLTLTLTEHGRKHTGFGWERIDIIDFGYDKRGALETVICVGEYSTCPHRFKAGTSHIKTLTIPTVQYVKVAPLAHSVSSPSSAMRYLKTCL